MSAKSLLMCCVLVALFALNQQTARADEIFISGTTTGSFNNGSTTLLGLTFTSASFSGTTSGHFLELDAVNNLGTFTLSAVPNGVYDNNFFTLQVLITSPVGISGSNPQGITGIVLGTVISDANGLVAIDFGTQLTVFNFDTGSQLGVLGLSIDPIVFSLGTTNGPLPLTGRIRFVPIGESSIPEPATLLLLGTGLAGVLAKVRRHHKRKSHDQA